MSNTRQSKNKVASLSFASINPYIEENIVLPTETNLSSKDMVEWGTGNRYPDYLLELYDNVSTLRSIISGNVDYIAGDDVTILPAVTGLPAGMVNKKGDSIRDLVRNLARDYGIYGGFAIQVIRNYAGQIAELYYLDMRFVRSNKKGDVFYYCEDWQKRGKKDCIVYPAFLPGLDWAVLTDEQKNRNASSVIYVKNDHTRTYPAPLYSASVKACEIERCIDEFHLNSINNQFVSSAIINFNNGIPEDSIKEQIEEDFSDKFTGSSNGGRVMFSWNKNKESATDVQEFKIEDFGERYKALSERSRQQIFTAFRANPNLFGIPTEGVVFSKEDYAESFKLYNRTQIQPVQRMIAETLEKIYGMPGVITIMPFSMGGETEDNVE